MPMIKMLQLFFLQIKEKRLEKVPLAMKIQGRNAKTTYN